MKCKTRLAHIVTVGFILAVTVLPGFCQNTLTTQEVDEGFELLFDGSEKSLLENWTIYVENDDGDNETFVEKSSFPNSFHHK